VSVAAFRSQPRYGRFPDVLNADRLRVDVDQGARQLAELSNPAMAVRIPGGVFGAACGVQGLIEAGECRVPAW